jgi:hypothetical protein
MTAETHPDKQLTRLQYAAPHLGSILAVIPAAIAAGVLGLGYFHPIVVVLVAVLVASSPCLGASLVMDIQGRKVDWRGLTLRPYVWWSVVSLSCFSVGMLIAWLAHPGIDAPNGAWAPVEPWLDAAGAFQLIGFGITFGVPVLRFIMWLIKPPFPEESPSNGGERGP